MLDNTKSDEPAALRNHRLSVSEHDPGYTPAYADSGWDKAGLKEALLANQADLCAYCSAPIRFDRMKVEHREPQSHPKTAHLQLAWPNLLGVCPGNEGRPYHLQHCDTSKGARRITLDPVAHEIDRIVGCTGGGRVTVSQPEWQREIDEVLRLNIESLIRLRKTALRAVLQALGKKRSGRIPAATYVREIARLLEKRRRARAYRPFVVFELRRRANR